MSEPLRDVAIGTIGRWEVLVTPGLTVGAMVEGMPPVYATPMMVLAMESASWAAVRAGLTPGWVTVGSEVNIRHLAPNPVGRTVTATATATAIDGRTVSFAVEAHDGVRKIGEGTHKRGAVNLERFAERMAAV